LVSYPIGSEVNSRIGDTLDPYTENKNDYNGNNLVYKSNEKICKSPSSKVSKS